MRHKVAGRRLGRDSEHRLAMRRNIVASLFEHETISTTLEKAKEVKAFAEKLITLAKQGTLSARRRAIALLGNRDILGDENGKVIKKGTVIGKLFSELGPRYLDRPGGYTRIIHLAMRRLGDNGQLVLLQLVGAEEKWRKEKEERKGRKAKGSAEEAEEEYNEAVEEEAVEGAVETEEEAAKNEEATEGAEKQE
ncbi:MAG: 50S ribosomal protein L17 [Planctomycetota bacterium]